jgi:hypothetical protein
MQGLAKPMASLLLFSKRFVLPMKTRKSRADGGEGGIRTLGRDLNPYNALAKRLCYLLDVASLSGIIWNCGQLWDCGHEIFCDGLPSFKRVVPL